LYGQSPWLVNAGINYNSKYVGANISYNRSGYRSYVTNVNPNAIEYENGRNLIDLQLSTRLLKQKAEIRLNVGNLLDEATFFYTNPTAYEGGGTTHPEFKLVNGTDAYEKNKGDRVSYPHKKWKNGRFELLHISFKKVKIL
jgi:hypothetical protein